MKTLYIIFMLLCMNAYDTFEQNEIKGEILERNQGAISRSSINSIDNTIGTTTNNDGSFTLSSENEIDTIVVSFFGYVIQMLP